MRAKLKDSVTREQFDNLTYGRNNSDSEFHKMKSQGWYVVKSCFTSSVSINWFLYSVVDMETLFDVEE